MSAGACRSLSCHRPPHSRTTISFSYHDVQRKHCRHQQGPARSNGHVQKSSRCPCNCARHDSVDRRCKPLQRLSHSAPLSQPVCAVANVTSSAVIASSCPPPPHLVVMCETVVSASTQMLVALALGVTPLHCSWLSSCACAHASLSPITDSFVLPLDAIIPKDYARLSTARARHARVTPLPLEGRALGGRRLGYYSQGANAARYFQFHNFLAVRSAHSSAASALCFRSLGLS